MAKAKKLLSIIICGILILIASFFLIRFLCFKVFIVPNWFSQEKEAVESVTLLNYESETKIEDKEKIDILFDLIDKNKISRLKWFPGHYDLDSSDAGYFVIFKYSDGTEECFRYGGLSRPYLARDNSDTDLFWIVGDENPDLFNFIKENFKG